MVSKSKSFFKQGINKTNNVRGFTLLEMIVVIAVLGALAALAIPKFTGVVANSQEKTDNANIRIVESALELYKAEQGDLPAGVDTFNELVTELEDKEYLKNTELKAVSEGKSFTYDAATEKISLSKPAVSP